MTQPRIIDCIIYWNEKDLFLARRAIMAPYVTDRLVVEGGTTFQGEKKEYTFATDVFGALSATEQERTTVVQIPGPAQTRGQFNTWEMEWQSRNAMMVGLRALDLVAEDIVIISDADEIPDLRRWEDSGHPLPALFQQYQSYYFMDYRVSGMDYWWYGTAVTTFGDLVTNWRGSVQEFRDKRGLPPTATRVIEAAGWHWSCLGGAANISAKLKAFAHAEYNYPQYTDIERLQTRMDNGDDFLGRTEMPKFTQVPLDHTFPDYVHQHESSLRTQGLLAPINRRFRPEHA